MDFKFFKKNYKFILLLVILILLAYMFIWGSKTIEGNDIDEIRRVPAGDYKMNTNGYIKTMDESKEIQINTKGRIVLHVFPDPAYERIEFILKRDGDVLNLEVELNKNLFQIEIVEDVTIQDNNGTTTKSPSDVTDIESITQFQITKTDGSTIVINKQEFSSSDTEG